MNAQQELSILMGIIVLYLAPVKVDMTKKSLSKSPSNSLRSELLNSTKYMIAKLVIEESVVLAKIYIQECLRIEETNRKVAKALGTELLQI